MTSLESARESGLIREKHEPLVDDHIHFCERAGIKPKHLFTGIKTLPPQAQNYLSRSPEAHVNSDMPVIGFLFTGDQRGVRKMMALMVGFYMRQFRDATLCTLNMALHDSHRLRPILCIHDFYTGHVNDYMREKMVSLLLEREAHELQTVVAVSSVDECVENLGPVVPGVFKSYGMVSL